MSEKDGFILAQADETQGVFGKHTVDKISCLFEGNRHEYYTIAYASEPVSVKPCYEESESEDIQSLPIDM